MLCSLWTDLIDTEVKCGECLCELVRNGLSTDLISSLLIRRQLIEKKGKEFKVICIETDC